MRGVNERNYEAHLEGCQAYAEDAVEKITRLNWPDSITGKTEYMENIPKTLPKEEQKTEIIKKCLSSFGYNFIGE